MQCKKKNRDVWLTLFGLLISTGLVGVVARAMHFYHGQTTEL